MANPIYTSIHHPIYNINGSSFYNETATPSSNDPHTADYSPLHTHTSGTPTHTSGSCTSGDDGMNSSGSCYSPHFSPDTKEEDIHSTTNELAPTLSKTHFDLIAPSLETDFLAMLEHDTVLSQLLYGKDNFFAHDTVSTTEDAWAAENSLHSLFSTDTDLFGLAAPPLPHTHYYLPLAEELISSERFQAMNSEDKKKYLCGRLQEANRRNVPILLEKRRLVEEAAFDIDLLCDDMLKKAKCSNQLSVLEERADGHIRLFTNF
ncbi:hypothetical protein BDF14DRAFT_1753754 [Spinellus fusiger]|nr:hypothetical protein BDF14DRAFT_1753754 [Spinellus fusiger]